MTAQTTTQRTAKHRLAVKERMAALVEALAWAVAEIEGRTRYTSPEQPENALQKAKEALRGTAPAKSYKTLCTEAIDALYAAKTNYRP